MEMKKRRKRQPFAVPVRATLEQFTNEDGTPDERPAVRRRRTLSIDIDPGAAFEIPDQVVIRWSPWAGLVRSAVLVDLNKRGRDIL